MEGAHTRARGLTLPEAIVTVAVVSLVAAVLAPVLSRHLADARRSRAQNEVRVIAAALATFYKDVGRWPTMDATGAWRRVTTLRSAEADVVRAPGCTPAPGPEAAVRANGWDSDPARPEVDFLGNHLQDNRPGGRAAYPVTGDRPWRGPYLKHIVNDPWNTPYMVSIAATDPASGIDKGFVLSAGPNRVMDTPFAATRATAVAGDDIGVAFFVR